MNKDFIKCLFCGDKTSQQYIYTQCNNLVCLVCASLYWDKKYSIKCNNKITFLEEQTCSILMKINKQQQIVKEQIKQQVQIMQNAQNVEKQTLIQYSKITQLQNSTCIRRSRQVEHQPLSLQQKQNKPQQKSINHKETSLNLLKMQKILDLNLKKVKQTYESYHEQLKKRQQNILKLIYNKYSHHLNSIKDKVQQRDIQLLNKRLEQILIDELINDSDVVQKIFKDKNKDDRILNKLEYNQIRMKEKINRHYDLLK